ncbi:hypothetical protein HDU86_000897 [Geranomyces michiganensis]|nr:hypothetical protein HDU86_000897 [Geranomyces michiganensis]
MCSLGYTLLTTGVTIVTPNPVVSKLNVLMNMNLFRRTGSLHNMIDQSFDHYSDAYNAFGAYIIHKYFGNLSDEFKSSPEFIPEFLPTQQGLLKIAAKHTNERKMEQANEATYSMLEYIFSKRFHGALYEQYATESIYQVVCFMRKFIMFGRVPPTKTFEERSPIVTRSNIEIPKIHTTNIIDL